MGLFEWLFERRNPHPIGSLELRRPGRLTGGTQRASALFSVLALIAWTVFLFQTNDDVSSAVTGLFATAVYLVAAYFLSPEPDYSNTGVFGFIDHPFRISDDMNRMLALFKALLWPGRLVATGVVEMIRIARGDDSYPGIE